MGTPAQLSSAVHRPALHTASAAGVRRHGSTLFERPARGALVFGPFAHPPCIMHPDHDHDLASALRPRPWIAPRVQELGALQNLTLQSGIDGGVGGFSWLPGADPSRTVG